MKTNMTGKRWIRFLAFFMALMLFSVSTVGYDNLLMQALAESTSSVYSDLLTGIDLGEEESENAGTITPVATAVSAEPTVAASSAGDAETRAPTTDQDTEAPITTEQPTVPASTMDAVEATATMVADEATPTVAEATATPQPEPTPQTLQDIIKGTDHTYLITTDSKAGVYSGYGMSNSQRIGTLNGRGALVFATDYVQREGKSAAILVWFDTDGGVTSGYVSEDRLSTEPMSAADAAEYIRQNRLDTCDFVLSNVHHTLAKADYAAQSDTGETTAEDAPVLYWASVTGTQNGIASLYETANGEGAVCATVQQGEMVAVIRQADGWAYVKAQDGDQGYLLLANLQTAEAETNAPEAQPEAGATQTPESSAAPTPSAESSIDQTSETQPTESIAPSPSETPEIDLSVEPDAPASETPSVAPDAASATDTPTKETAQPDASAAPTPSADSSLDDTDGEGMEPSASADAVPSDTPEATDETSDPIDSPEPSATPETTDETSDPIDSPEPLATPEAMVSPSPLSELPDAVAYAVVKLANGTAPLYAEASPIAAVIDQLTDGTYVGVIAVDNDWAHVYVRKGEGFLQGYLANTILVASKLSTKEPIPTPAPLVFVPMRPEGLPGYYLAIGTAEYVTTTAPAAETAPAVDDTPAVDETQEMTLLEIIGRFFIAGAAAEETGTSSTDIYTFIGADGVQYYRVYGMINGVEGYYACDENGTLLEPYQLVDMEAEQDTLASGTPSISTRGLANFSLSPMSTPETVPSYYTSFPAGENTTVYTFVGRDGVTYYRIYGTNTSGVTGFFECDQYGENEAALPVVLNDEFNTLAPYVYASLAAPSMPTGLVLANSNPYLYSYPGTDGATQYRIYGVKLNDPADTAQHWYATDATGKVIKPLLNDDIQLDMNNLWINGFIEATNPGSAPAPSFYGVVGNTDNTDTIKARQLMWAYTDRTGVVRYRVYGTVNGVAGFYECDADGNVLSLTSVDLANEQLYLSPLKNGIADDYIPGYAKVISTNVTSITDGTPVWDATTSAVSTGTLGNDSSPNNLVVRSFDQVAYELDFVTELNTALPDGTDISNYKGFNNAKVYLRFEVPVTLENDVSFVMSDMGWLKDGNATYDAANHKWILTGYRQLTSDGGNIALPNRATMNVIMRVNGAANAQLITPSANIWLDQGTDAGGTDLNAAYAPALAETTTGFQAVRVTAAPKYNVGIKLGGWFSTLRFPNTITGELETGTQMQMLQHLIFTAEIRNDSAEKGLKGIEFPRGDFSFDVTVTSGLAGYDVTLWEYSDNTGDNYPFGYLGRRMNNNVSPQYTPTDSNGTDASLRNTTRSYFDGGSFTVTVQTVSATQKILHVTVKDYRIDGVFPTKAGTDDFSVVYGANEGVFSVGNIEVAIKTNPVTTTTTVPMTATVSNLSATSSSGVATTTDVYSADNSITPTFTLYPPGSLTKTVYMVSDSAPSLALYQGAYSKMRRGEYARSLATTYHASFSGTTDKVGALDLFTKFDAEGYTVTNARAGYASDMVRTFYGALPSGGNWTSDAHMQDTRQEALDWYTSLAALGSKKCVAVLFEYRGEGSFLPNSSINVWNYIDGYVPETATVNKVYQAVSDLKWWTNATAAAMTADTNTIMNNKGASNPAPAGAQFTNSTAISGVSTNPYGKRTYNMDTYETTGGHTGGYIWGTSWLVIADYVQVSKTTAQSADNTVGGTAKSIYSLNDGERRVDYAITPTYSTGGLEPGSITGTVTITDTLPKYLNYVPGSSYQGGTYVQGSSSESSYHTGGTALPPTVSVNSTTGETTLTWTLSAIATAHGDPMEKIYFSATIGDEDDPANDPANNAGLLNSVTIAASTAVDDATASKSITVTNLADMTLTKNTAQEKVELGENVQYDMVMKNNSITNQANLVALDILPYNGDDRGTDFDGTYIVKQIIVQQTSAANTNLTLHTTTGTTVRTLNARSTDLLTAVTWANPAGVSSDGGKTMTYYINGPLTGLLLTSAVFEAQSRAKITVILEPSDNLAGNVYANNATMDGTNFSAMVTAPVVSATVVQRSISGLAWIDINKNGQQDATELKLPGLEAQLYAVTRDAGGNITATTRVTSDIEGNAFGTVITDAAGRYTFEKLPAGEYQVRLYGYDDLSIDAWQVTTLQASGVSESINSNAVGVFTGDTLNYATIDGISLPDKQALTISVYNSRYNDAGFYAPTSFAKDVSPASGTPVRVGDVLTYTIRVEFPAAGVTKSFITDTIPEGTMFVPGSIKYKLAGQSVYTTVTDAAYAYQTNTITFPKVDLVRGENEFVFQVVVDTPAEADGENDIVNFAILTAPDGTEIISNETVNTLVSRYANIAKTAALVTEAGTLEPNDSGTAEEPVATQTEQQVEYILTVTAGGSDQLTSGDLVITDPLPAGTTQVNGSLTGTMLATATASTATGLNSGAFVSVAGGYAAQWTLSGLKTGDVVELRFRVTAPAAVDPVTQKALFENQATLTDVEQSLQVVDATAIRVTRDADGNVITSERITESTPIYTEEQITKESEITYHEVSGVPHITAVKTALPLAEGNLTPVVKAGDTITYYIDITNDGDGNAYTVLVYDAIPEGTTYVTGSATMGGVSGGVYSAADNAIGWSIPLLIPGQTVRLSFQVTVDASDQGTLIRNVARYSDPEDPLDPGDPEDWPPTDPVEYQTVTFTKTSVPAGGTTAANATTVEVGDVITYTLTVDAGAGLTNVTVSDRIPDGLRLVSDSIGYLLADGTTRQLADTYLSGNTITWPSLATLPAGENVFTFSVVVERLDGLYTVGYDNFGTVRYDDNREPGSTMITDSNHVTHKASVSMPEIHKTAALVVDGVADTFARGEEDNPIQAQPDQQVEYILTVTGHGDDSGALVITDQLPSGTTYVSAAGVSVSFSGAGNGGVTYQEIPSGANNQTLTVIIDQLSDGQVATIRFRVIAPPLTGEQTERFFNNTAFLYNPALEDQVYQEDFTDSNGVTHHAGDPIYSNEEINQASETTYHVVRDSLLAMVKTATPAYIGAIAPVVKEGDTIQYTLTITNSGTADAINVYVRDVIPASTSYVAGSADHGGVYDAALRRVDWIITSVPAGGAFSVSFAVTVDAVSDATLIQNAAIYKEVGETGDPEDPTTPWVPTNPTQHQTISAVKTVSPSDAFVREGQLLTYTIMVKVATTDGGVATGVVVSDTLPEGLSIVAGSIKIRNVQMSDACYSDGVITWPATDLPVGETPFSFSAIVDPLPAGTYRDTIANTAVVNEEPTTTVTSTVLSRTSSIAKEARLVEDGVVQSAAENGTADNPVEVACGEEIEYTLLVTNTGDPELISGAMEVTDALPNYVTLVPYSDTVVRESGSTATVSAMSYANGKVSWTVTGMKGNETLRLKFRVRVLESFPGGVSVMLIVNQGHLSDTDLEETIYEATILNPDGTVKYTKYRQVHAESVEQDSNQTYHEVLSPVATIEKTSQPIGDVQEGQIINYAIRITIENAPLPNWTITDVLPQGIGFVSGSLTETNNKLTLSDNNYNASSHTITIAGSNPLPVGEYEITFKGLVLKLAEGQTVLQANNTASIQGDGVTEETSTSQNRVVSRYAEIEKTAALITLTGSENPASGGVPAIEDAGTATDPVLTALGQVVEYRLRVRNHASGGLVSDVITVVDVVPNGTTLIAGSITAGGTLGADGRTITWTLSNLVDGDVVTLSFRVYAPLTVSASTGTTIFTNIATLHDTEVENRTYEETVTVIGADGTTTYTTGDTVYTETEVTTESNETYHEVHESVLEQVKASSRMNDGDPTVMGKPVKIGDVITYTIVLRNTGAAAALNVMVRDYIPTGTAYEAGSGMMDGVASPDSSLFDATRDCVTWHVSRIDVNERVVFSYRVVVTNTVDASGQPITIRNIALFDTDVPPESTDDPTTPTNPVENPTLAYTKEASPSGDVREGQVITYRIRVNASADMLNPVTMTDTLPTGVSLVAGSIRFTNAAGITTTESDSCWVASSRSVVWPAKTLLQGESVYELKVVVNPVVGSNTSISLTNTAVLRDDQNRIWPEATVTQTLLRRYTTLEKTAALVVSSANGVESLTNYETGTQANPVDTQAGQTIQYILTVRNVGPLPSGEIIVQDVVPTGLTYVSGSMTAVGGKVTASRYNAATRTVIWTLNAMEPNSAQVLVFRATTPLSIALYENQATLSDIGLAEITYSETVTTVDGVTHTTNDTVYTPSDTTILSDETFHEVDIIAQNGQLTITKVLLDYYGRVITTIRTFVIRVTGPSYPNGMLMELTNATPLVLTGLIYGQYSVEELNTTNYDVTITAPVTLSGGATSATITVRNQDKDKSLPVTGESTIAYTIGGLIIVSLGFILLMIAKKKRKSSK